eukprot:TRINITY_DN12819_c0_g1_i1.p1 TRINITY_DN12819_c0_g1~~TRINITY_DN12819_c0_g1_i1.p1  ORF type:complete len:278 (+),score=100.84 TRINITY_DN12819_c0_g1_i1:51-884(+)
MVLRLLTIAGSDSGGGAGIQADLKTFAAHGCYGMTAITALTSQNTVGVHGVWAPPPESVASQVDAVLGDIGCDALKTGMLCNAGIVRAVVAELRKHPGVPVVVDPVLCASTGDPLLEEDAVELYRQELLPLATVATPNVDEAGVLVGRKLQSVEDMEEAAKEIVRSGCKAVVVKGGDLSKAAETETSTDVFFSSGGEVQRLVMPRLPLKRLAHGTGCSFAAAVACALAKGQSVSEAALSAKKYIHGVLEASQGDGWEALGKGQQGPLNHMHGVQFAM